MNKSFLPIGSVVLLEGASKMIMINGYCAVTSSVKDKVFDYRGCPYPEGIIDSEGVALFDDVQIEKVCFEGFRNDESKEFIQKLETIVNK